MVLDSAPAKERQVHGAPVYSFDLLREMPTMIKYVVAFSLILLSKPIQAGDVLIDVPALAGKNKLEVSELIGSPVSCAISKYGEKCQFEKAETEIVFIEGRADWITVEGLDEIPFSNSTLEFLGFASRKPTFSNSFTKRWEPLQGLRSVSLFKGGDNSDYAYIKAYTR